MKFYSFVSLDPEKIDCFSQQTKQTGIDEYIIAMIAGVSRMRISLMTVSEEGHDVMNWVSNNRTKLEI